jgi:hypothetical protein
MSFGKIKNFLKKIDEKYWENHNYIFNFFIIFICLISVVLFFTAFHNKDLIQNYALIYNDLNLNLFCSEQALDIREISDTAGNFEASRYKEIYIKSTNLEFTSYFLLFGVIFTLFFAKWKIQNQK